MAILREMTHCRNFTEDKEGPFPSRYSVPLNVPLPFRKIKLNLAIKSFPKCANKMLPN